MHDIKVRIEQLRNELHNEIKETKTVSDLEALRIKYLGRNGSITGTMALLKDLSVDDKKVIAPLLNELKKWAEELYQTTKETLENQSKTQENLKKLNFDVTAYKKTDETGSLHIFTKIVEQLEDIFISMGYDIASGPEVVTDYYNFEALNIPAHHPARDLQDTFWLTNPQYLLRTHTSTVQIQEMENQSVPLAVFAPGRVYRNEATDATHDFQFMQGEGLFIDKNISVAHLLATSKAFLRAFFEKDDLEIRARPGYFPFVEPGIEIDASCPFCKTGCSICKHTGWIELMGSGMIHPNVLRMSGIDPEIYSGFAWGFGIERLTMVKHGITDIRLFRSGKIDFLKQF
jgi:phenylalanyl-tRNA synthetase alpha chain